MVRVDVASVPERPPRAEQHLDQFVAYMKSKPGVWFATAEAIARYVKDGKPRT
jgi:hypothetical protein